MSETRVLTEAPRVATKALEAALRGCPRPTYFGEYDFAPPALQEQLDEYLYSRYLTELEFKWVLFMRVYFNVAPASKVIAQLAVIVHSRKATGAAPAPNGFGSYFPAQHPKPRKPRP